MNKFFANTITFSLLLCFITCFPKERVEKVIESAKRELMTQQKDSSHWIYPAYLGTNFISQYYVVNHLVKHENKTSLDGRLLKELLLKNQLLDGSWKQVPELNKDEGEIDTTIYNYWALKVMGEDPNSSAVMQKARAFILKKGGLEAAQTMTKFWLAMFGNYDWDDIGYIPLFIFHREGLMSLFFAQNFVAQWVYPHLIPMAYTRSTHVTHNLGNKFSLNELHKKKVMSGAKPGCFGPSRSDHERMIERMLEIQQPMGSFGAYTVSSLFSIVCFKDFLSRYPDTNYRLRIESATEKAYTFIEWLYLKTGEGAYKGVLDDGRFWDTALTALALAESKEDVQKLFRTVEYFSKFQQPNGGIPYGLDFEYAPDTDDTALAVTFMCKIGLKDNATVKRALAWLKSMQNSDGGWAAFDRNRGGNWILSWLTSVFANSAEAFDPSCVDLTGHIIEAFGTCGINMANDKDGFIKDAINYIKKQQANDGKWEARWGLNYIYAAGAALPGLKRVGVNVKESWIAKGIDWIVTRQNTDGGFGESTLSYVDEKWAGRGVSTPSQTAWALLALLEVRDVYHLETAIERAVSYLTTLYEKNSTWVDESSVGTGHRKILYMQYPAYSHTFPLIVLARYLKM